MNMHLHCNTLHIIPLLLISPF